MPSMFIGKGNLADSPEGKWGARKTTGEQFYVATMRVMFGRSKRNARGEFEQVGGFWRAVSLYGKKGEDAVKHLRKGARVLVMGEEREFKARNEEGEEVELYQIVAEDVALVLTRVASVQFEPRAPKEEATGPNTAVPEAGWDIPVPEDMEDIPL